MDVDFGLPGGGTVDASVTADPSDYIRHIRFLTMLAGEVRYERYSLFTDVMYLNAAAGSTDSELRSVTIEGRTTPLHRSFNTSTGVDFKTTIWTLAGGYTVGRGNWGSVNLLGGFRLLAMRVRSTFNLTTQVTGPRGFAGPVFGGSGTLTESTDIWFGVIGLRGRFNVPNSRLYVPYYFDLGFGSSNVTWQAFAGLGYDVGWGRFSAGWRYFVVQQSGGQPIRDIVLNGPLLGASFTF
jgi:hypothetical protein